MPLQITLGGRAVQDAVAEAQNLARLGYPPPPAFARANSLSNPRGDQPARGWFLLLRQDLAALNLNALLTLVLADDFGNKLTVPNLVVAREPTCITPSGNGKDPLACYLVEVADSRWRTDNPYYSIPADAQYNVRAPGWAGEYYAGSLNAGSAWTWSGMVGNLWGLLASQLGTFPGFPAGFSPDGVPERYRFQGVSAWRGLCQVLAKLGLAISWQAGSGKYVLVQIGAADAVAATALQGAAGRLIFDRQFQAVVRGRVPAGVAVHFHRVQEHYGTEPATEQDATQFVTSNVYVVKVAGTAAQTAGAEAGTYHPLWDDLPALYDPAGNLLNAAALTTRAQARATAFYAALQGTGGGRKHQVYAGLVNIAPGSTISGVCWRQDLSALGDPDGSAGGLVTEVVTLPAMQVRVADNGEFVEALEESTALHPPDLRVKEPTWPDLLQALRVTSSVPDSYVGSYPAIVEAWNSDTSQWMDRESCRVLPANGEPLYPARYLGRLVGWDGAPLYVVVAGSMTQGGAPIAAEITGPSASIAGAYDWIQVEWNGTGWVPVSSGSSGVAYEANGNTGVPAGTIVFLVPLPAGPLGASASAAAGVGGWFWFFAYCCTGSTPSGGGSGSSGGGSGVQDGCCNNLPSTLHLTLSTITGSGTCLCWASSTSVKLTWNSTTQEWFGSLTPCDQAGGTTTYTLKCVNNLYVLTYSNSPSGGNASYNRVSTNCSTPEIDFAVNGQTSSGSTGVAVSPNCNAKNAKVTT